MHQVSISQAREQIFIEIPFQLWLTQFAEMSLYVHPEPGPNGLELVFSYRPEIYFWMRPRVVPRPSTPDLSIPVGRSLHGIQYIEPNLTPWLQDAVNRCYTNFAFPEMIQRFNQLLLPSHAPLSNSRNEWHFELREGVVVGDNTAFLHFINMDSSMHFTFGGVPTNISKFEQAVALLYLFLRPFIGGVFMELNFASTSRLLDHSVCAIKLVN